MTYNNITFAVSKSRHPFRNPFKLTNLTSPRLFKNQDGVKTLTRLTVLFVCNTFTLIAMAGPESLQSGKEMQQVSPPPPSLCDWSGFYVGLHAGGQFGHSEDVDLDDYDFPNRGFGYSESGVVAGGQIGYNFQWHRLVVGPELDIGYMNLEGTGTEPGLRNPLNGVAVTDSDFYATFRGRIGLALDCWLIYGTGGAIGVNYDTRYFDHTTVFGRDMIDASKQEIDWGYTVGGGVERMLGRHWSIKVEYLYFSLAEQSFSGQSKFRGPFNFQGETTGHIVRGGLNFRF